ncbi:MAG: hypothetical protein V7785_00320 [Bermanella sp.]
MKFPSRYLLIFLLLFSSHHLLASQVKDLKYGTILFDYYQQNYFSALVGYEYAKSKDEFVYNADQARLLKGGMSLSYGLPDDAQAVFSDLLEQNVPEDTRNKAWFYLAKMYYYKGDVLQASRSLSRIQGDVPDEIHQEFNYLATLINIQNQHLDSAQQAIGVAVKNSVYESYLIFNLAVTQLANGQVIKSQNNLQKVVQYSEDHPEQEFAVLADRAKQALAHISIEKNNLTEAWQHLQNVRTTGLYSNRALLSYGWTAIKLKHFNKAISALKALNKRSISIAEVQEAKVLLAHLYEQVGATRKALKQYLLAQKSFDNGLTAIKSARRVIAGQRIPEEFVINLEAMMDETDWYGSEPSLDYSKLTPFLIELMSSNPFHSVIKELRDLYALRKNLDYWQQQAHEHMLIIKHRQQGQSSVGLAKFISDSEKKQTRLEDDISDLRLHIMTLDIREQKRFSTLLQSTQDDFDYLDDKVKKIKAIKEPYRQSEKQVTWAKTLHKRIGKKIQTTNYLIKKLEDVMRVVVNAELDNHQERMTYYLAQARLGKARLYDQTLYKLENDAMRSSGEQ